MSKQVDERIVSMQFDNADFEKKVSQTQQSIKDLNNTINSADASKINESLLRIGDTLDVIKSRFSAAGVAIGTVISNLTSQVMEYGSKLSSFVSGGIIQGGYNRAMKLEKAQFAMEGLIDDAEEIKAIMDDVNYGVQNTAYGLDAAATVASQLVATGLRSGEEMRQVLRGISGVAAQTSSSYEEIGHIFTTISGQGKVTAMQLSQLAIRGMNAAATLAEYFRKTGLMADATEADIRELVSKGAIDFQIFAAAMDDAFGAHAYKANETLTGVLANVRAALAKIGVKFIQPLIQNKGPLVDFFESIRSAINKFKDTIDPIAEVFVNTVTKMVDPITRVFNKINEFFEPIQKEADRVKQLTENFKQFQGIVDDIWGGKYGNWEERWAKLFDEGYDVNWTQHLVNATEFVKDHDLALVELTDDQLREIYFTEEEIKRFNELRDVGALTTSEIDELKAAHGSLSDILKDSFTNLAEVIKLVVNTIQEAFGLVYKGGLADKIYESAVSFKEFTKSLVSWDTEADKFGEAGESIVRYSDKLTKGMQAFKVILVSVLSVLKIVKSISSFALKLIWTLLKRITDIATNALHKIDLPGIANSIAEIADKIADWFESSELLSSVLELIGNVLGFITDTFSSISDYVKDSTLLQDAFQAIAFVLSKIVSGVSKLIGWIRESKIFPKIIGGAFTILSKIGEKIVSVVASIKEWWQSSDKLRESFSKVGEVIGGAISGAWTWITTIADKIREWYESSEIAQNAAQLIHDAFDKVSSIIEKVTGKFTEWSEGLKDGSISIKDIFEKIFTWIVEKATELVKKVINILLELPGKIVEVIGNIASGKQSLGEAFSGIFEWIGEKFDLSEAGVNIVKGLAEGIGSAVGIVWEKIVELAKGIISKFCDILGIHSPSTVFEWIAEMIITPLINIARKYLPAIKDVFSKIADAIIGIFTGKDLNTIFDETAPLAGITLFIIGFIAVVKLIKKVKATTQMLTGFIKGVTSFMNGFGSMAKGIGEAAKKHAQFELLLSIAILIGVIAAAIYVIGNMEPSAFFRGIQAIIVITIAVGVILGLSALLMKFNTQSLTGVEKFKAFAVGFLAIGAAFVLFGIALAIINKTAKDRGTFETALWTLAAFAGLAIALIFATKLMKDSSNLAQLGAYVALVGLSFVLLAVAFKMVTDNLTNNPEASDKALLILAAFGALVVGLIAISKLCANNGSLTSLAGYLLAVSAAFIALGVCMAIITKQLVKHPQEAVIAVVIIGLFGLMLVGLIAITKLAGSGTVGSAAGLLLGAAACFIAMGLCLAIIARTITKHPDAILPAIGVIAIFGLLIVGLIAATKLAGTKAVASAALIILAVAALFATLAAAMWVFSLLDPEKMWISVAVIAILMTLCAGILAVTSIAKNATATLIMISVLVAVLTTAIFVLTTLDQGKVLNAALALSAVMVAMGIFIGIVGLISKNMQANQLASVALLMLLGVLVIAAIGAVIWGMQELGVQADYAIAIAQGLTALMLAFGPMLMACAVAGSLGAAAFIGIGALAVLIIAMGAIMLGLSWLASKFEEGDMLNRLNAAIPILESIGTGLGTFLGSFTAAFSAAVMEVLSNMIRRAADDLNYFAETINSSFIPIMSSIDTSLLEGVGVLAGALALLTASELVNGLLSLFGIDVFSGLEEQFGYLASALMTFWLAIKDENIDKQKIETATEAVKTLAEAASSIPNSGGLFGKIFGENDMDKFGEMLSSFAKSLIKFIDTIENSGYTKEQFEEAADIAAAVGKTMASFAKEIPNSGGIVGKIMGENDLNTFGKMMEQYALSAVNFCKHIQKSGYSSDQFNEAADIASSIGMTMANFADNIPNSGGILGKIMGDNDLDKFGAMMESYSNSAVEFTKTIIGSGYKKVDFFNAAAIAGVVGLILSNLVSSLPETGGWKQILFGEQSLSNFGTQMEDVAKGIVKFLETIGDTTVDEAQIEVVNTVVDAIVKLANAMPDVTGGIFSLFTGTMSNFAGDMKDVAQGIVDFCDVISGGVFGEGVQNKTKDFAIVVGNIVDCVKKFDGVKFNLLSDFITNSTNLHNMGSRISWFLQNIDGMPTDMQYLDTAVTVITKLTDVASNMKGVDFSVFSKFTEYLNGAEDLTNLTSIISNIGSTETSGVSDAAVNAMSEYANAITDGAGKMREAAEKVVDEFISALEENMTASKVSKPFESALTYAKESVWSKESDFYNLGNFIVAGFANGIDKYAYLAEDAAARMTNRTINRIKNIPMIQSPSKVTFGFGKFIDLGFANGIEKYGSVAVNAASGVTQDTIDAFSRSASKIASIVENNIDTTPTITPVLDLSNVTNNANRLNSLLSMGSTIGLSANAQIAAARMSNRQNGNSDIISAINGLSDNLGNNGDVYNINGITYDDGSAVSNAVSDLISAIRMERRM